VVSDLNGNITLVAGTGVTLTGNNTAKTITIASAGTGTVNTGLANRFAFYPSDGTTVDDSGLSITTSGSDITLKNEIIDGDRITLDCGGSGIVSQIQADTGNILLNLAQSSTGMQAQVNLININQGIVDIQANTAINLYSNTVIAGKGSNADASFRSPSGSKLILGSGSSDGAITINSGANGNIELTPAGTGDVLLNADTVRVGDNNVNAVITTQGTGDLTLNTNTGTNSGSITIADGANGAITIDTDGTGFIKMGGDVDLLTGVIGSSVSNTSIELEPNGTGVIYLNGPLETNTTTGTPVDDTAPTSWLKITVGTTDYFLPLYE
jgi:hypothetical protein